MLWRWNDQSVICIEYECEEKERLDNYSMISGLINSLHCGSVTWGGRDGKTQEAEHFY